MNAKRGLGRGFESLIPTDLMDESFDPTAGDDHRVSELRHIKISEISPDPEQPRHHFAEDALSELTESIRIHGVLQPIVVTPHKGMYVIVAGERRFRASKAAGKTTIPALVRSLTNQHKLELALIENIQRRNLSAIETATAYAKLRDQFNLTLEEIGKSVGGKSISAISNTLRLLRLPKAIQKALGEGKISEGQARPLIDMDEKQALALLPRIVNENLSARVVEQLVNSDKLPRTKSIAKKKLTEQRYLEQSKKLVDRYGSVVKIQSKARGGQIVIPFSDDKDLERLMRELG